MRVCALWTGAKGFPLGVRSLLGHGNSNKLCLPNIVPISSNSRTAFKYIGVVKLLWIKVSQEVPRRLTMISS